jgi:DNA invertase Pin-like site-specific DNA recombinase
MLHTPKMRSILASTPYHSKIVKISVLYVRTSTADQKTDRQRVNESSYDKVIEDKCSGTVPMFERQGGAELKKLIDMDLVSSVSVWQIDRCGRDLRDIINFIYYATEKKVPIHFVSQGLVTLDDKGNENPISKMIISILGVVAEMERKLIRERQLEGIGVAKLQKRYTGRKQGTTENALTFLSKPRNRKAVNLLKKGYKMREVAHISGISINTVSKVKRMIAQK